MTITHSPCALVHLTKHHSQKYPRILPLGDAGFTVEFGHQIAPAIHDQVLAFTRALEARRWTGLRDIVPTYRSATVYVDPGSVKFESLDRRLLDLARTLPRSTSRKRHVVTIPVAYGGDYGPDLEDLATAAGLSPPQVVALHTSVEYRVYMLGFSPGFPYLGQVPEAIAAPRLAEPRSHVPAGSVGIAGFQTGIYPQECPGGWRLIGRTPARLYDPTRAKPFLLQPGDRVRFHSISQADLERLATKWK